jgi:hypothetical protein
MYTKDVNERSPLRVFEKSIHGGLGRGNLGVVMSRAGIGKTAFLIGIGLDDLMRERRVLHFSAGDSVDHVIAFYDEVFAELSKSAQLKDRAATHLMVERCRIVHTYRGVDMNVARILRDTDFYRQHASFEPDVILIDGFDFAKAEASDLAQLKEFVQTLNVELWLSALTHRHEPVTDPRGIPDPAARVDTWISVMVQLEAGEGSVTVQLLKDHENTDVSKLHMKLDPKTLLLLEGN